MSITVVLRLVALKRTPSGFLSELVFNAPGHRVDNRKLLEITPQPLYTLNATNGAVSAIATLGPRRAA
jgi:hypothetical protein